MFIARHENSLQDVKTVSLSLSFRSSVRKPFFGKLQVLRATGDARRLGEDLGESRETGSSSSSDAAGVT